MSHMLGNFVYTLVKTDGGSDVCSGTSLLTVCDDRQQFLANHCSFPHTITGINTSIRYIDQTCLK
jgi:hypothetical protein